MARRTHVLSFLIRSLKPLVWPSFMLLLATALGACGGTGLRPQPLPYTSAGPIAAASDQQIEIRHTMLPLSVPAATETSLQLFFPIVPPPRHLLLSYRSGGLTRHIVIDTSSVLGDLHIASTAEEL